MGPDAITRLARQPSTVRPAITEIELCAWLAQADPGDVLEYYRGLLAVDRAPFGQPMSAKDRFALGLLGDRAMRLADHGFVHLLQRRLGPDNFSYLAIARPRPRTSPVSLSSLLLAEAA
jgi:hypothetical protein